MYKVCVKIPFFVCQSHRPGGKGRGRARGCGAGSDCSARLPRSASPALHRPQREPEHRVDVRVRGGRVRQEHRAAV